MVPAGHGFFFEFLDGLARFIPKEGSFKEILALHRALFLEGFQIRVCAVLHKALQFDIGLRRKLHLPFLKVHHMFLFLNTFALVSQAADEPFFHFFMELTILHQPDEVNKPGI